MMSSILNSLFPPSVNPGPQVADHVAVYPNPAVQAGAGHGFNQNSGQFAAGSQGQEGAGNVPAVGYAYHLDAHAHDNGPAGSAAAGYSVEVAEPVFSDVSDLDPVYTFRSRSSYNNGRVVFVRTSYNPAEPEVMPVYRSMNLPGSQHVRTNVHAANDQAKGRH